MQPSRRALLSGLLALPVGVRLGRWERPAPYMSVLYMGCLFENPFLTDEYRTRLKARMAEFYDLISPQPCPFGDAHG